MNSHAVYYLVVREHCLLGYREYLAVVSAARDIGADAQRLFARDGWTLSWLPVSRASKEQKRRLRLGGWW